MTGIQTRPIMNKNIFSFFIMSFSKQTDLKLPVSMKIIHEAIQHATAGKSEILNIMATALAKPRDGHKDNSPVTGK